MDQNSTISLFIFSRKVSPRRGIKDHRENDRRAGGRTKRLWILLPNLRRGTDSL